MSAIEIQFPAPSIGSSQEPSPTSSPASDSGGRRRYAEEDPIDAEEAAARAEMSCGISWITLPGSMSRSRAAFPALPDTPPFCQYNTLSWLSDGGKRWLCKTPKEPITILGNGHFAPIPEVFAGHITELFGNPTSNSILRDRETADSSCAIVSEEVEGFKDLQQVFIEFINHELGGEEITWRNLRRRLRAEHPTPEQRAELLQNFFTYLFGLHADNRQQLVTFILLAQLTEDHDMNIGNIGIDSNGRLVRIDFGQAFTRKYKQLLGGGLSIPFFEHAWRFCYHPYSDDYVENLLNPEFNLPARFFVRAIAGFLDITSSIVSPSEQETIHSIPTARQALQALIPYQDAEHPGLEREIFHTLLKIMLLPLELIARGLATGDVHEGSIQAQREILLRQYLDNVTQFRNIFLTLTYPGFAWFKKMWNTPIEGGLLGDIELTKIRQELNTLVYGDSDSDTSPHRMLSELLPEQQLELILKFDTQTEIISSMIQRKAMDEESLVATKAVGHDELIALTDEIRRPRIEFFRGTIANIVAEKFTGNITAVTALLERIENEIITPLTEFLAPEQIVDESAWRQIETLLITHNGLITELNRIIEPINQDQDLQELNRHLRSIQRVFGDQHLLNLSITEFLTNYDNFYGLFDRANAQDQTISRLREQLQKQRNTHCITTHIYFCLEQIQTFLQQEKTRIESDSGESGHKWNVFNNIITLITKDQARLATLNPNKQAHILRAAITATTMAANLMRPKLFTFLASAPKSAINWETLINSAESHIFSRTLYLHIISLATEGQKTYSETLSKLFGRSQSLPTTAEEPIDPELMEYRYALRPRAAAAAEAEDPRMIDLFDHRVWAGVKKPTPTPTPYTSSIFGLG